LIFDSWRNGIQLLVVTNIVDDWKGITGDPVKFGLGMISFIFDIIFMIQVKPRVLKSLTYLALCTV
jgi:hypothetical protein